MAKKTTAADKTAAQAVLTYAADYAKNRGLKAAFPRIAVAMMADILGWPVRNVDGGSNIAYFTTQEAAELAIAAARRELGV
jgi:hypothetical protein